MTEIEEDCKDNIEAKYEKFKDVGKQIYQQYEERNKHLCSKLNANHLDPFARILLEQEKIVLHNQDELMETVRNNLEKQMQKALDNLWQTNAVSEALISLEILKEKFKPYEGHKWNLDTKTPLQLTQPIRMRFKENRLRYLQAQLDFQNTQLNEVLQETEDFRQNLRDVKHHRNFLIKSIEDNRRKIKLGKSKIMELQQKMLLTHEEKEEIDNKNV